MESLQALAAANNAAWCDAICRSHGIVTQSDKRAWTASTRTPPYYPDAVTLSPDASADELLSRIDRSPGCSIKDSFASLDLMAHGFCTLFDAEWIVRHGAPRKSGSTLRWDLVRDPTALAAWHEAWSGGVGPTGIFLKSLLDRDSITVLAGWLDGRLVAGAVLNRTSSAVGFTNYFNVQGVDEQVAWSECVSAAVSISEALPLVGYESGHRLRAALSEGFEAAGALRVWTLPM